MTFPSIDPTRDQLPLGRFMTSFEVIEEKYVDAFPASSGRRRLFDALVNSTHALGSMVSVLSVWVGGSFASPAASPGDVDVTYWVDFESLGAMTPDQRLQLQPYNMPNGLKRAGIPIEPFVRYWYRSEPGNVRPPHIPADYDYATDRGLWDDTWSRSKSVTLAGDRQVATRPDRGYLEVIPSGGSSW